MTTSIKLKSGEEWYLKYVSLREEIEIFPFQNTIYDQMSYLPNGTYELLDGRNILIEDKKIIKFYEKHISN